MIRSSQFVFLVVCAAAGCNSSESSTVEPTEPTAPAAVASTAPLVNRPLQMPLTSEEIDTFLEIVKQLPEGQVPELPRADLEKSAIWNRQMPPEEACDRWRKALRSVMTTDYMSEAWEGNRLGSLLRDRDIPMKAFASVALRIIFAEAALRVGDEKQVRVMRRETDQQIDKLTAELEKLRTAPPAAAKSGLRQSADLVWESLRETIALSEFLRAAEAVPTANRKLIHSRTDVVAVLKKAGKDIRPVSHEQRR